MAGFDGSTGSTPPGDLTEMQVVTYAANINNGVTLSKVDQFTPRQLQQIGTQYSSNVRKGIDKATCSQLTAAQQAGIPVDSDVMTSICSAEKKSKVQEQSKVVSSAVTTEKDQSKLSSTSTNSKTAKAIEAGGVPETFDNNEIVVTAPKKSSSANILKSAVTQPEAAPPIPQAKNDRRARLSPRAGVFDQLITTDGIMAPLRETYGLMFPITPTINENVEVNYETYDMAHGLMPIQAYRSGGQKTLSINAMFVAQTDVEARYCLACIHFIRSFSKMNFGDNDPNAGTPPPILVFNAYGDAMFHNLPVVISNASFDWPNDVDYVYTTSQTSTSTSVRSTDSMIADGWVPSKFTMSLSLIVQPTPAKLRKFNLEAFRNGTLLTGDGGWI